MKLIGHNYRFQRLPRAYGTQLIVWQATHTSANCMQSQANVAANVMCWSWLEHDWWRLFVTGCHNNHQPSPSDEMIKGSCCILIAAQWNDCMYRGKYIRNVPQILRPEWHINCKLHETIIHFVSVWMICRRAMCTRKMQMRTDAMSAQMEIIKKKKNIKLITMAIAIFINWRNSSTVHGKAESVNCQSHSTRTIKSKLRISHYYIIFGESDSAFASQSKPNHAQTRWSWRTNYIYYFVHFAYTWNRSDTLCAGILSSSS